MDFPIQGLRPMSKSLPKGLKTILKKGGYNYASIINYWSDLVGKQISDVCYPKSIKTGKELKDGILYLNVFHGDQLLVEYNKTNIIDKINVFFGYQFVKDIRIILIKERIDPKKHIILLFQNIFVYKLFQKDSETIKKLFLEYFKFFHV